MMMMMMMMIIIIIQETTVLLLLLLLLLLFIVCSCNGPKLSDCCTQTNTTLGRTPLDNRSARGRDLYLTTHNYQNRQTFMPPAAFEPAFPASEWPQTQALDRVGTGTGDEVNLNNNNDNNNNNLRSCSLLFCKSSTIYVIHDNKM